MACGPQRPGPRTCRALAQWQESWNSLSLLVANGLEVKDVVYSTGQRATKINHLKTVFVILHRFKQQRRPKHGRCPVT